MTIIHVEGFARRGSDYSLDYTVSGAGTLSESTMPLRRDGCTAILLTNKSLTRALPFSSADLVPGAQPGTETGFAFQWGGGAVDLFSILADDLTTVHLALHVDASGYVKLYRGDSATGVDISSAVPYAALSTGVPYYVWIVAGIANSGATLSVNVASFSGDTMYYSSGSDAGGDTQNAASAIPGGLKISGGTGGVLFADWFASDGPFGASFGGLASNAFARSAIRADVLLPARARTWTDWAATGAASTTATVNQATPDGDTSYISATLSGRRQTFQFGPLPHSPVFVAAVRLLAVARATGTRDIRLARQNRARGYGIIVEGPQALTTSYAAYDLIIGDSTQDYTTATDINEAALGVECGDGAAEARVTHLAAHVLSVDGGATVRATQMVVQTLSDAQSDGEVRATQMVVQTLTGSGDRAVVDTAPAGMAIGEPMQLVAEIMGVIDTDGNAATLLVTDGPAWATKTTCTPASAIVHDRLTRPATMQRTMFTTGATLGAVSAGYGVCEIANTDGQLDAWADYSVAGQTFTLRAGRPGDDYPADFVTLIRATMQSIECDLRSIKVRLRDRLELLERALLRNPEYPDPQVYGQVYAVPLKLIDEQKLIYAAGRPPAGKLLVVQSVRDNGARIAHDSGGAGDYTSTVTDPTDLNTEVVGYGRFNWCPATGWVKLGSPPAGTLTATVYVIDDSATWTPTGPGANARIGTILSQMAQAGGINSADIVLSDVNTVDLACGTTPFGAVATSEERTLDVMNRLANSIGVWFGFDRLNLLRMAQLGAPSTESSWTFTQHNMLINTLRRVVTEDPGRGVPVWRVVTRSNHNDAPMQSFAGSVSEGDKALMRDEWPVETTVEDPSVLGWCGAPTELVVDVYSAATGPTETSASVATDDAGEAARRLALMSAQGEMVEVEVPATPLLLTSVDIGSTVQLKFPRYGWNAGETFIVIGVQTS